jgi:glutathione S-transferase
MADATLTISSKNYSSWCLRGWLITRMAGLNVREVMVAESDEAARQELLIRSSSTLVPCLTHDGVEIWDTMGIAAYLNEQFPEAKMLPEERYARARCWSISGEMHSGFVALRSALPMNLRSHRPGFVVWSSARADIDRILSIWRDCLGRWGGPFLFGDRFTLADAMYAPVCTRLRTYDVKVDALCEAYVRKILALPDMVEWKKGALQEKQEVLELEVEF